MQLKKPATFKLSAEAFRLLNVLSRYIGVSKTDVTEVAIRELARAKNLEVRCAVEPELETL